MVRKSATAKEDDTSRRLLEVTMLLMRSIAAHMRQSEQRLAPAQVGILARLGEHTCTLSDLAQHQAVRLPTISRSVSMLVDRGLVERRIPEHNRRQTLVGLTPEGRNALAAIKREAERHTASILADFSDAERRQVHAAAQLLSRALGGFDTPARSSKRGGAKRKGAA